MTKPVYADIATTSTDADSPIDETLTEDGYNVNLKGLRFLIGPSYGWTNDLGGDGSTGSAPASATNTDALGSGKQYDGDYTVSNGHTRTWTGSSGFTLFACTGTLTVAGTITVTPEGFAGGSGGPSSTAGSDGTDVTLPGMGTATGGGGGSSVTYLDGGDGGDFSIGAGGSLVAGGAGNTGAAGDGADGTDADTTSPMWWRNLSGLFPSTGGGGGGGGGSTGGDGGAGGSLVIIECETFVLESTGVLTAPGEAGSAGGGTAVGAGGGGGGGTILVFCKTFTDNSGTISCPGGSGGASGGAGGDGGDGGAGRFKVIAWG